MNSARISSSAAGPGASSAEQAAQEALQVWVIEPRATGLVGRLREAWRSRHLLRYFAIKTLQRRYQQTILGWWWLIIRPLFPVAISTMVFNQLAGIGAGSTPYPLFFLVGSTTWNLFEESLMWATRSLQMNRGLLRKLYFPRIVLPAASMSPAFVELALYLGLIIAFSAYFLHADGRWHLVLGPNLPLSLAGVGVALVFALGIGFFTAVLGAEKRDLRFTLPYILQFWFYVTPIAYPATIMPESVRWVLGYNPLALSVELFRWGLLGTPTTLSASEIASNLVIVALVFGSGLWFFVRAESAAVDRI